MKAWKFRLLLSPFIQSRKCISFKVTGEVYLMAMKNDWKYEEHLTWQFKIYLRNLKDFYSGTQKSKKFVFNGLVLTNSIMFEFNKYRYSHNKRRDSLKTRSEIAVLRSYVESIAILEPILLYWALKCKQTKEQGSEAFLWSYIFTW